jgi:3-oxoacyl-[acyl-carrier protein] reductase
MAGRLDGKVALVTGASRGIGRAIALTVAREGGVVVVNYVTRQDEADRVVAEILAGGGQALAVRADVSQGTEARALVEGAETRFGRIDVLVNNAGVFRPGRVGALGGEALAEMMAVNVHGVLHCVEAAVPGMRARRSGRIVTVSSIAALGTAAADTTPYAMTKAAVTVLTKRLALELGPHGITVNAVCPGFVATDMAASSGASMEAMARKSMLGQVGAPEDIAHAVLFLASDEARFVTAQVLTVDGGRMDFLSHSG